MVRHWENTERGRKLHRRTQHHSALFGIRSDKISSGLQGAMNANISKLLDEIPEKSPRSKLELHADVIAALRQKRRTYREIAEFFREHLAITVAPSTIHDFVRVRRRRGKRNAVSNSDPHIGKPGDDAARPASNFSPPDDDLQQKMAALKRRAPSDPPQPIFTYDENEPLTLRRKPKSDDID
jgi:hypothetical protein